MSETLAFNFDCYRCCTCRSNIIRQLKSTDRVIDYLIPLSSKTTFDRMHPDGYAYKRVAEKLADNLLIKSM